MIDFNKKIYNSDKFESYLIPINLNNYDQSNWKFSGIYKITNKINGHCYIDQAIDIRKRLQSHNSAYIRKDNKRLYKAIEKYGIENFEVCVLVIINLFGKTQDEIKKELNAQEIFYINLYNSYQNGYNSTPGGDSGRLGFKHSKETIEKLKEAHKNYKPKRAFDVSKKTYGYDLKNKVFIEGESVADISHKTQCDQRSIGQICNNKNYKNGGRFISNQRFLFSFIKEDLLDRIDQYYSEEYNYNKKHRKHGRLYKEN